MNTVYNQQDGPYIQTFIFENTGFMIGLLKKKKTAEEMSDSLNYFQDILPYDMYQKLFSLILTECVHFSCLYFHFTQKLVKKQPLFTLFSLLNSF